MEISVLLRVQLRRTLEAYCEYRSLASLRGGLPEKELLSLHLPTDNTDKSKEEAIDKIINHFLDENFLQKAYIFLSFFLYLRESEEGGAPLRSTLNTCYEALKDEILLAEIASLYEDEPTFHITVNGGGPEAKDVKELAEQLSKNNDIREELSRRLRLSIPFANDEFSSDFPDVVSWHRIVKEVILILKECFAHTTDQVYDIEYMTIDIMESGKYEDDEWMHFYKDIVCEKLAHKKITNTPLKHLQKILNQAMSKESGLSEQNLQEAYTASLSASLLSEAMPILPVMLYTLAETETALDSIPIIKFVEYLINDMEDKGLTDVSEKLRHWNSKMIRLFNKDDEWLDDLREQVRDEAKHSMYLLIAVKSEDAQSKTKSKKKQKFLIRAWLVDDEHKVIDKSDQSEEAVLFDDIPQCIDVIRTKIMHYLSKIDMVDLFLEHHLLSYDFDSWQIKTGLGTVQFVAERAWVVRFLERTEKEVYLYINKNWTDKWRSSQSYGRNGDISKLVHMFKEGDCANKDAFYRKLMSSTSIFCVALDFVPSNPHTPMHIFTNMLNAGIPIIFWCKQNTNVTPPSFSEWFPRWLEELINEKNGRTPAENLKNLPFLIWEERMKAEKEDEHIYHLILLWDDPHRLLPQLSFDQKTRV